MIYSLILAIANAKMQEMELPPYTDNLPHLNLGDPFFPIKTQSSVTGGHDSCLLLKLTAQSQDFLIRVDTGSSDTALPAKNLNSYIGPAITYSAPSGQALVSSSYGDSSSWSGYQTRLTVGVFETSISAVCPISVMTSQSTDPIFSSGRYGDRPDGTHGLLGVGFPSLAKEKVSPRTVLEAMYSQGQVRNNAIGILGCPYGPLQKDSWVDLGNEDVYDACGGYKITIGIPSPSYYNLNITAFAIQGVKQPMPDGWQPMSGSRQVYSILDSCTSNILLPTSFHTAFVTTIKNSKGLSPNLKRDSNLDSWLAGKVGLSVSFADLDYSNLPSVSFTIRSQATNFETITLTLGPRQYFQLDSTGKFTTVLVNPWKGSYIILGMPVFLSYHVMADLNAATLTFRPGCGCARRLDKYPKFFIDEKPVCTYSPDPIFSVSGNATTEPPPGNTEAGTCQDSVFLEPRLPNSASSPSLSMLVFCMIILQIL